MVNTTHEAHNDILGAMEKAVGKIIHMRCGEEFIEIPLPVYFLLTCGIEMSGEAANGFTRKRSVHSWGFKTSAKYIISTMGAFKLFLSQDKNWGINDNITWSDGHTSRQKAIEVADSMFDFAITHQDNMIKVVLNNTTCECDECLEELGSIKALFKKAWRDIIKKKE